MKGASASEIARVLALKPRPHAAPSASPGASEGGGRHEVAETGGRRAYEARRRSWIDNVWAVPKGLHAWVGASGPLRVRGPFTEHRSGNGVNMHRAK